ncbi:MAG: hypothetical protein AB4290_00255 [Spirulina sp.]
MEKARSQIEIAGNRLPRPERPERKYYYVWEGVEIVSDRMKTLVLTLTAATLVVGAIPPLTAVAQNEVVYDCVVETNRGRRERRGMNRAMAWGYLGNDVAENSAGVLSSWRGECYPRSAPSTTRPSSSRPSPSSSQPSSRPSSSSSQPSSRPSPQPSTSSQPTTSTGLLNSCQNEVAARLAGVQASKVNVESSSVDAGGNAIVNWNSPAGQSGFCRVDPFGNIIEFRQN